MRVLVILAVLAAGAGGVARQPSGPPALRVVRDAPLTLRGSGFRLHEPVTVTVRMGSTVLVRRTRADAHGSFAVRWAGTRLRSCTLPLLIRARGRTTGPVDADLGRRDCAMP